MLQIKAFILACQIDIDWPDLQIHQISLYNSTGPDEPKAFGINSK